MNRLLESYIDDNFVYVFAQGPDVVRSREDALRMGINCVSLAHLAVKDLFNRELPPDLLCTELYYDQEHSRRVDRLDDMVLGDLVWLGVAEPKVDVNDFVPQYQNGYLTNWPQFPVNHVAIFTGERDGTGDPLLLHASQEEGTNVVWPLKKFDDYPRYQKLYGISRLLASQEAAA